MKHKKLITDFAKFVIIGIIWSGLNVVSMWLLVDILHIPTYISSTIAIINSASRKILFICINQINPSKVLEIYNYKYNIYFRKYSPHDNSNRYSKFEKGIAEIGPYI